MSDPHLRPSVDRSLAVLGVLCVLVVQSLLILTAPCSAATLRVGLASIEITPPVGTPLGGYAARKGAPSTGVHDPITAKALVLDDGAGPVAIVATDLIGTSAEIRRRVLEKTGLPSERLLLCASHTHSGPGAFDQGPFATLVLGEYDPKVFNRLADGIAEAVIVARQRLAPGRVGAASRALPGHSRNRRQGGTLTDPELTVFSVRAGPGTRGTPSEREAAEGCRGALVNFATHGTVLDADNLLFSADWMGPMQAELERRLGRGAVVLYTNGAEGDQSPVTPRAPTPFDAAEAFGKEIAGAAAKLLRQAKPSEQVTVKALLREVPLPRTPGAALLGAGATTPIQTVAVGDALLIAIPGEMIAELGLRLKAHARALGWKYPFIVGLANDHLGYLLTEVEFRKGGYEAGVSFFGPRFGEELTDAVSRLIDVASGRPEPPIARRPEAGPPPAPGGSEPAPVDVAALTAFLRDWFAALPGKIGALPSDARARFRIQLSGEGGGTWRLDVGDGSARVGPEAPDAPAPDLTVSAAAEDWAQLVRGKLDVTAAFSGGKLSLQGDLTMALRLAEWLGLRPRSDRRTATASSQPGLARLELARLARVHADVEALRAAARPPEAGSDGWRPRDPPYQDIRAVIHSHSYLSHDSRGTVEEILAGAKAAGVRVVLMTDHYTPDRRFLREGLRGMRDGVLFIPGTELSSGLLAFRIDRIDWPADASAADVLRRLREGGGLGFIAHPEGRADWSLPPFVGMEIYNTHADAEDANSAPPKLQGPEAMSTWLSLLQAFRRYPREAFASIFDVPAANLARWDQLNGERRVVGIAGNDSHNNVGAIVQGGENGRLEVYDVLGKKIADVPKGSVPSFLFGGIDPAPGQKLLEIRLDPYDVSYGYVSTHILAESVTEPAVLDALTRGRCYVAFDWLADPTGFTFEGRAGRRHAEMGDTLRRKDRPRLRVLSPLAAEIRLLRNGQEVARATGPQLEYDVADAGAYRVEVWVTVAGEPRPWIYANPIRIE
jgi:hypothetical protein